MAGQAEHVNVGTGAEDALFAAGQHDGADLRVFEADPVHGVVQLDIDPEVVAIQLELVAGAQAGIFVEIRDQRRHRSVEGEFPVPVAGGVGLVIDGEIGGHGGLRFFGDRVHRLPPPSGRTCARQHVEIADARRS